MFKLNAKFDADSLIFSLSHFECNGHTVHMLTQWHPVPPLTSTVKSSSLFTHVLSSPFSLAARSHQRHANCSHYLNSGAISGQTFCEDFILASLLPCNTFGKPFICRTKESFVQAGLTSESVLLRRNVALSLLEPSQR